MSMRLLERRPVLSLAVVAGCGGGGTRVGLRVPTHGGGWLWRGSPERKV